MSTALGQYDAGPASYHDLLVGGRESAVAAAERCAEHVRGRRVLDVGVGTGRVATLLCSWADAVVGIDNAPAMLALARQSPHPGNLSFVEADFRRPLPLSGTFGAAVALTGSLACVGSAQEFVSAMVNLRSHLDPDAAFVVETYAQEPYLAWAEMGAVEFTDPETSIQVVSSVEITGDRLTVHTRTDREGDQTLDFVETVYLPSTDTWWASMGEAGFVVDEHAPGGAGGALDWWLLRTAHFAEG